MIDKDWQEDNVIETRAMKLKKIQESPGKHFGTSSMYNALPAMPSLLPNLK